MARGKARASRKDGWVYMVEGADGCYVVYPTLAAAEKAAMDEIQHYYDSNMCRVEFYQLAKVIDYKRTVEQVPVMTKKVKVEKAND